MSLHLLNSVDDADEPGWVGGPTLQSVPHAILTGFAE